MRRTRPPGAPPRPKGAAVLPTRAPRSHERRGMNPTPSPWLLGWLVLGAFTTGVVSGATASLPLPVP